MVRVSLSGTNPQGGNGQELTLPTRPKDDSSDTLSLEIHPLESADGLIVTVQPPKQPSDPKMDHVPCDIVLVIDVSGSMGESAPVPTNPGETKEDNGLSVLDLVKHAARTILETLGDGDRLGIVTFHSEARVLQELIPMDKNNKEEAKDNIERMEPETVTNLWHGILEGIKLFKGSEPSRRVPAMMVLTDGRPNFMCPPQGYIPKLRNMEQLPATIHTFGFGYNLRSGLLKSIAEFGNGDYSFIPDAGMIGTVFVHAVANLQSTFANHATLRLTYPSYMELHETTGESVVTQKPVQLGEDEGSRRQLTISLGNLQYGQSRDIYLRYGDAPELRGAIKLALEGEPQPEPPIVKAVLEYSPFTPTRSALEASTRRSIADFTTTMTPASIAYHKSRSAIVSFISSLSPLRDDGEHVPANSLGPKEHDDLARLTADLPAAHPPAASDPRNRSLVSDLCGDAPRGQVRLACKPEFLPRWGAHYLPSLAGAHARQVCNSFKDAGPLAYGADSPLFVRCRDRLDAAFDGLPAPRPSNVPRGPRGGAKVIDMSWYNRSSNPCFAGSSRVLLAATTTTTTTTDDTPGVGGSGGIPTKGPPAPAAGDSAGATAPRRSTIRIGRLRPGMSVQTPLGPRRVAAVLRTRVRGATLCLVGGLLITPWHPVSLGHGGWAFPARVAGRRAVRYTGTVYSVLLERDADVGAHAVMVDGVWGVTLGHGLVGGGGDGDGVDVRAHRFFGDYELVARSLAGLKRGRNGVVVGGGVKRDPVTGLVCGFKRAPLPSRRTPTLAMRKMATYA